CQYITMDNLVHFTKNSISEFNDESNNYSTEDDLELIEVMNS
ncbi:30676_t:CDS:1, partial [Gigaspora margarita]